MTSRALSTSAKPTFRYLTSWFCPFAHRATLALEHHSSRINYKWIEALGWEKRTDPKDGEKVWHYHWKADELKRSNPSELIPTLIPVDNETGVADESKAVYESLITIDYIDLVSKATGKDRLVPEDPYEYARSRYWAEKVNKECCSPYYGILVRKDPMEQKEHFEKLLEGLRTFSKELSKSEGPLFLPDKQLSNVDLSILPWASRYYVFDHYRGDDFVVDSEERRKNDPSLKAYFEWFDYIMDLDSVKRTLPGKERYLEHIGKYADASARSKVANAVRRGVQAHELDDKLDEY